MKNKKYYSNKSFENSKRWDERKNIQTFFTMLKKKIRF